MKFNSAEISFSFLFIFLDTIDDTVIEAEFYMDANSGILFNQNT